MKEIITFIAQSLSLIEIAPFQCIPSCMGYIVIWIFFYTVKGETEEMRLMAECLFSYTGLSIAPLNDLNGLINQNSKSLWKCTIAAEQACTILLHWKRIWWQHPLCYLFIHLECLTWPLETFFYADLLRTTLVFLHAVTNLLQSHYVTLQFSVSFLNLFDFYPKLSGSYWFPLTVEMSTRELRPARHTWW